MSCAQRAALHNVCVYTLFSTHRLRLKVMSERVRLGQSHDPVAKKASHFMLP